MKINSSLINKMPDYLYGLNFHLSSKNLEKFRGIRYVLMQGSDLRAKHLAEKIAGTLSHIDTNYFDAINLTPMCAYSCYRVGDILSVSHGMGSSSIMTFLHDISKIMYFAKNHDVKYIRIGTSGGLGIDPGVVVITDQTYMPNLIQGYQCPALEKNIIYPTHMNSELNQEILEAQPDDLPFSVLRGNTIAADDFYLGQSRFDGAIIPPYDEKTRESYFQQIKALSIYNMEMESAAFACFCHRAEISGTMVAATIINRYENDQFSVTSEQLAEWSDRSQEVIINFLQLK